MHQVSKHLRIARIDSVPSCLCSSLISQPAGPYHLMFMHFLVCAEGTNYAKLSIPGRGKCLPSIRELSFLYSRAKLGFGFDSSANTLQTHIYGSTRAVSGVLRLRHE